MVAVLYLDLFHLHISHGKYALNYLLGVHPLRGQSYPLLGYFDILHLSSGLQKSGTSQDTPLPTHKVG